MEKDFNRWNVEKKRIDAMFALSRGRGHLYN